MDKKYAIPLLRIAFGYQARVGKDTAAAYLIKKHGGITLSFARAIYDIMNYAQDVCGFEREKDRHFLQYIGTQWARAKDPDVWLNVVLRKITALPNESIYITDVRFPNEFDALRALGFTMVNIRRDVGRPNIGNGSTLHESETALIPYTEQNKWDITINNDGSLYDLYEQISSRFLQPSTLISSLVALPVRCPRCNNITDHMDDTKDRCYGCYKPNDVNDEQE